ncbi:heat shock protein beta-7-like [Hypomesus transpacificus]|uniref:heat shock protein beta-7-like n=1 Tax=Hypomesus transpacificus TaxID=137520 RepID=UPI001F0866A0|nr:heat shock protein beta-7-like [Hypomesus transpacificus]
MASLTSSSSSRSSSSSYRSSSRYSSCSSFRSEESAGGQTLAPLGSPLGPLLEPFLDPAAPHSMFGEEDTVGTLCRAPFSRHRRESHGYQGPTGGAVSGRPASMGAVRSLGDSYSMSADVSQFEPHDVVVMAYNHHIVIHAEKVLEDGSISNTFTHKSLLPEDMDPLSVSGTLTPEGMLVVSVRRTTPMEGPEPPAPTYYSEAHL